VEEYGGMTALTSAKHRTTTTIREQTVIETDVVYVYTKTNIDTHSDRRKKN
jgi:hypothetical protein